MNSFLLVEQLPLLVNDLLDPGLNSVLHFLGLDCLGLSVCFDGDFVGIDLLSLLLDLGLVLHVFLPQIVEVFFFLVDLNFALSHLVDQLFSLSLHVCNYFNFFSVLPLQDFYLNLVLLVSIALKKQGFQQNVYLIVSIQLFEVGLQLQGISSLVEIS